SGGRTSPSTSEETDEDIWKVRELPSADTGERRSPVLTSVPALSTSSSKTEKTPAETKSGGKGDAPHNGTSTLPSDVLSDGNGSAPSLPTRTSKVGTSTEPSTDTGSPTMVEAGGGR